MRTTLQNSLLKDKSFKLFRQRFHNSSHLAIFTYYPRLPLTSASFFRSVVLATGSYEIWLFRLSLVAVIEFFFCFFVSEIMYHDFSPGFSGRAQPSSTLPHFSRLFRIVSNGVSYSIPIWVASRALSWQRLERSDGAEIRLRETVDQDPLAVECGRPCNLNLKALLTIVAAYLALRYQLRRSGSARGRASHLPQFGFGRSC